MRTLGASLLAVLGTLAVVGCDDAPSGSASGDGSASDTAEPATTVDPSPGSATSDPETPTTGGTEDGSTGEGDGSSSGDEGGSTTGETPGSTYEWDLPEGFPEPAVPDDNPMSAEKVELGRHLFYDVRLSANETQSCGSCHFQELAFTDGLAQPIGSTGDVVLRSSMSLGNVAYSATHTWANPLLESLSAQAAIPLFAEDPVELGAVFADAEILERLHSDPLYDGLFAMAYPDDEDAVSWINIRRAIASFERTLITGNAPYDRFQRGDVDAVSDSAKRGSELFFSERLECHHCHNGFNLTNSTVHANTAFPPAPFMNTGLYNIGGQGAYPAGGTGLAEFTLDPSDIGKFKPPSLRNIAVTGPYMHDGSVETLEDVIDFYAAGGRNIVEGEYAGDGRVHPNKSGFVTGFTLTEQERADVLAFLESLTDEDFLTNPAFANPWK